MSNFQCKVKIKKTGEIQEVTALDDWYGKHEYGYENLVTGVVYREDEVEIMPPTKKELKSLSKYKFFVNPPEPIVKSMSVQRREKIMKEVRCKTCGKYGDWKLTVPSVGAAPVFCSKKCIQVWQKEIDCDHNWVKIKGSKRIYCSKCRKEIMKEKVEKPKGISKGKYPLNAQSLLADYEKSKPFEKPKECKHVWFFRKNSLKYPVIFCTLCQKEYIFNKQEPVESRDEPERITELERVQELHYHRIIKLEQKIDRWSEIIEDMRVNILENGQRLEVHKDRIEFLAECCASYNKRLEKLEKLTKKSK